ncbi:L-type lectin-domain containing receptor kinase IX.1 [Citrus sinensis]|uniref:L-type lectin-domain containing receptor kinase IX.1 n=1 Tax=Citrus sinensis TaxID=2711 RepID=A0ACB8JIA5_CITSI|nr:L-type lectin-domain containing receptor kinase IX.1 [Citrus sinensis]
MAALINGLYSLLFLAIFFLVFPPSGTLIHFKFSRFDLDTKNIVYEGDATPFYGAIELSLPAYASRVGWAIHAEKLPLWDSDTRRLSDYNTQFSFMVDPLNSSTYGQAIAFSLLQWLSSSPIVLVEFDSFSNPEWDPINVKDHVSINNSSIVSSLYTRWNNSTTKNLSASWSYGEIPKYSQENTSRYTERHVLKSWEFNSTLDIKEINGRETIKIKVDVGVSIGGVVIMGILLLWKWKQRKETETFTWVNDDLSRDAGPRRFSYKDLASATNNFSNERKLGQGGFGAVYRGILIDLNMAVAYITEVKTCSQLRHRNLLQLIGLCHDRVEFMLVYEFMPNGSLDFHLFSKKSTRTPLTWTTRYKISLGLASALLYLHEEWKRCVLHRDIKSSNIMPDTDFDVKLGDFGLALLVDHELGPRTTGLAGTLGYMAPEYISTGRAKWVWDLYGKRMLISGVDERLDVNFDEQQTDCLMIVGLWCAHPDRNCRPSIRQAIQVLNFETKMPNLPSKMPVAIFEAPASSAPCSSEPFITNSCIEIGR